MFTSALFLSGYVLQQQTVRDLRAAIQPKPTPEAARLYLPSQFAVQLKPSPKASADQHLEEINGNTEVTEDRRKEVEMKQSSGDILMDAPMPRHAAALDDTGDGQRPEKSRRPVQDGSQSMAKEDQKSIALMEGQPLSQPGMPEEASSISSTEDQPKKEKTLSRAARRKKIKEEIMATGDGEGFKGYKRRQY